MNNLQIFNNNEFGCIRTLEIDGEYWFIGKDIANILGYQNGSRDINRHVDEDDRQNYQNGTFESNRGLTIINESGLYSLILGSKLESAKRFKKWVTREVLPTLRKTGIYTLPHMSKELQAILMVDNKTEELREDFNNFRDNAPLFNIECERLTKAVRKKVIKLIGIKTPAYNSKSLRGKVFSDLQRQIKREFDVDSYKAIKRKDYDIALSIVEDYTLPMALEDSVRQLNSLEG
ncbi:ORF6C domain-containing protein [Peptostreptococcus canis]|uniref:Phage repressor protein n=1 Tax=Peptostreptococcus canis TaxID=1159213 RepID=A0ABR6TMC1_9FIRM|nr:ORF6C domain-containing protein [Peptostreptococcus canis]MBC2576553.1 phage repressor protein [Peptostreptococcus canis]MBP1998739.1 prophage antirepressor-like protein [Peptostreptococcus canis]